MAAASHDTGSGLAVREVTDVIADAAVLDALNSLLPQLSRSAPPLDAQAFAAIVGSDSSRLLIAEDTASGAVLGSMTLVLFPIPTGIRAWIEDVVVDEAARGRGVGEALNRTALDLARSAGATTVDLTSRPSREAANRLYQRLGFVQRETNVYRFDLRDA